MSDLSPKRKAASPSTVAQQRLVEVSIASASTDDFDDATRGLIAEGPRQVQGRYGQALWDRDAYAFFDDPAYEQNPPNTVNPSLWRQGRLNNIAGLFEVAPSIFQVRGMDISNITFIAGATGWIVIDPLTSQETASAALALVNEHLGERPVHAVIYTHSHTDHFGGVYGIISEDDVASGRVAVIAPAGFLDAAVSENVLAGTVMIRRAMYMYGVLLPKDPQGHVDTGLGKGMPGLPTVGLCPPTKEIVNTGEEMTIDAVRVIFQLTPGTEAPAEMNIFLPEMRALCMAENCTATQHNVYTLRGAQVRDALLWSKYIDDSLRTYAGQSDVLFASHHWPRWGTERLSAFLESQRDAYRYVHDQTLRLANLGMTMDEIAETLSLPSGLGDEFFNRDYYGTVSHNAKAVYQRYLGWFDANPAHLHPHPPVEAAARYVAFMGGAEAVVEKARTSFAEGDYRWVAEVVNHVVFSDPDNDAARNLQADALEQLGYQSESGPWRDFYLTGAMELRSNGTALKGVRGNALGSGIVRSMTCELLLDLMGVRLNGPKAADYRIEVNLRIVDRVGEAWSFGVRHGVLHARQGDTHPHPDVVIELPLAAFGALAAGSQGLEELMAETEMSLHGDRAKFEGFLGMLDVFEFGFEIVLP
jgi:alkyl sulfatase BDS1-like metallo-beta-lactamase superfamily hydrolase